MTVVKRSKRAKPDPELVKLADSLLINYKKSEDLIGENGLLKQLTKMLVERALEAEMTEHLGMARVDRSSTPAVMPVTVTATKPSRAISANCCWPSLVTARRCSSLSW
jgi:hypothetical protein